MITSNSYPNSSTSSLDMLPTNANTIMNRDEYAESYSDEESEHSRRISVSSIDTNAITLSGDTSEDSHNDKEVTQSTGTTQSTKKNNNNIKNCDPPGFLKIVMGPMFSGKTSSIIELHKKYSHTHMNVCVINYAEDKRYSNTHLSTHDKIMIPCLNCLTLNEIFDDGEVFLQNVACVDVFMINEAQFFPDLKESVMKLVEHYGKTVYVFGLDGDFRRDGFKQMLELIPLADEVEKKYSICKNCKDGTRALFSHRTSGGDQVKVIGADNYVPLCRKCYLEFTN